MPRVSTKQLTDTRCQRAKVKKNDAGLPVMSYEWDSSIRGFGLRITQKGAKTFCLKFVDSHGKQAWMPLGPYTGEASLESAKERAGKYRTQISEKKDPKAELKKALDIPTFAEFVKTHLAAQKKRLRATSYTASEFYLDKIAAPEFKGFRINEVERAQVEALVDKIATGWRPGMRRGEKPEDPTPTSANRLHAALSKLFTEAERKGYRTQGTNPCKLVEKKDEAQNKERFLTTAELKTLGDVMRKALADNAAKEHPLKSVPYEVAAIKLLMLTGARRSEILTLKWSQVDRDRGVIRIAHHKTSKRKGAKEIPLNAAVLAVLADLEALTSDELKTREQKNQWVIRGHRLGEHLVNLQKPWERIRDAAKCSDVRIHDLRHTFASFGIMAGQTLAQVGSQLGHSQPSVTQRYAHFATDQRLESSEKISTPIAEALG